MLPPVSRSLDAHVSRQVEVEFFSGPNLVSYQYMVSCYSAQDAVTCADVVGGDTTPIDSATGSLPLDYDRVLVNMTVRD